VNTCSLGLVKIRRTVTCSLELNYSRQSRPDNLTANIRHAEGNSVGAALAEINLLSTRKYKPVNRTCCDTCTHRFLITEYFCIVCCVVFVNVITDMIDPIKPTYNSSRVRMCHWVQFLLSRKSSQAALSKLHITTRTPLRKETMFADCDHCPNHPWEP
jgi:hypothetical protein